jgi:HPt (histidine-containing phosphotransfer) domain-containing protein
MLVSFIDSTKKGLKDMQEAVISGQWKSVADLAHKIIPPCRHIGATDLCNFLRKIEENIQNNVDTLVVETLTGESVREFEAISDLLKEHIAKIN